MPSNILKSTGWTSLHEAALHPRELRYLEELLKIGAAGVNQQSWCGETPLHVACKYGRMEGVKEAVCLLLQNGANVNMRDTQGRTPLLCAVMKGKRRVSTLLSFGHAVPDLSDVLGENPGNEAASKGHLEIVECLIQAGASVLIPNMYGETPVHLAAEHGLSHCLEKLLQVAMGNGQKEVVDFRNGSGSTPLMSASWNGHVECVQILLKFGANPYLKAEVRGFDTALHFAIEGKHAECIKLLLDNMDLQHLVRRADIISTEYVCLLLAVIKRRNHDLLKILLSLGFPVDNVHNMHQYKRRVDICAHTCINKSLPKYQTSLSYAAAVEDIDSMKILLDYGASVNPVSYEIINKNEVQQKLSFPPVLSALRYKSWKAFDLLIEHGCDVSCQPDNIDPREYLLLSFYNCDCVKKLLICGSDPHLIFQQKNVNYQNNFSYLFNLLANVDFETFFNILELLLEFTVISQTVQCFFYDVFKLCHKLFPNMCASEWYNERRKAILQQVDKPSSLGNLCRTKIRQVMISAHGCSSFRAAIHHLCLPDLLTKYLLYSEINGKKAHFI